MGQMIKVGKGQGLKQLTTLLRGNGMANGVVVMVVDKL